MKLYEFQAKELFKKYGILTPIGKVVENVEDVSDVIKDLNIEGLHVHYYDWNEEQEAELLHNFDIGIMLQPARL
ncbi:MAG: ATP-grasp domain-containing protein [Thermoplasmata archaeon]